MSRVSPSFVKVCVRGWIFTKGRKEMAVKGVCGPWGIISAVLWRRSTRVRGVWVGFLAEARRKKISNGGGSRGWLFLVRYRSFKGLGWTFSRVGLQIWMKKKAPNSISDLSNLKLLMDGGLAKFFSGGPIWAWWSELTEWVLEVSMNLEVGGCSTATKSP